MDFLTLVFQKFLIEFLIKFSSLQPSFLNIEKTTTSEYNRNILIFNVTSGQFKYVLEGGHTASVNTFAKLENNLLASGSKDATICIWNLETGQLARILAVSNEVLSLLSLGNNLLASGSKDGYVFIWNVNNGEILYTLPNESSANKLVKVNQSLLAVGLTGKVMIWNFNTGELVSSLINGGGQGGTISMLNIDYNMLASEDLDGTVSIWNLNTDKIHSNLKVSRKLLIPTTLMTANSQLIAVGNSDNNNTNTILIYDMSTGSVKYNLTNGFATGLKMLKNNMLASTSVSDDGTFSTLNVWNLTSGKIEWFSSISATLVEMSLFEKYNNLVIGSYTGSVYIYNLNNQTKLAIFLYLMTTRSFLA